MKSSRFLLPVISLSAAAPLAAQQNLLVIGDSLTKEYRITFPGVPSIPPFFDGVPGIDATNPGARNWAEILDVHRAATCDLGRYRNTLFTDMWDDLRLLGHEYNFAVPGFTARQMRSLITQQNPEDITSDPEMELLLDAADWEETPAALFNRLAVAGAAVIWVGGNDVRFGNTDPSTTISGSQIDYGNMYEGDGSGSGNPAPLMLSIENSIKQIAQRLRTQRPGVPIVICAVPHVGCTPTVKANWPTDLVKTGRITAALEDMNARLRTWTETQLDAAWVDTYTLTKDLLGSGHMNIGGVTIYNSSDTQPSSAPTAAHSRYIFSHDGFHPTSSLQAKVAQLVLQSLRQKYPAQFGSAAGLGDREILRDVLGIPVSTGFTEFMNLPGLTAAQKAPDADADNDGLKNIAEFALAGNDPAGSAPVTGTASAAGGQFTFTWMPRFRQNAYAAIICEKSGNLNGWTEVPAAQITENPDGSMTATVPATGQNFLRLKISVTP
jgi:lysophospholipase L1-like esterase